MLIELLVTLFYGYAAVGAVFGLYFVSWGAARIDSDARQLSVWVRMLLWPASVALWPVLWQKVRQQKVPVKVQNPTETNASNPTQL